MARLRWNESIWDRVQRVGLWTLGVAIVMEEFFIRNEPRPVSYPIIAGLLGFPIARAWDRARVAEPAPPSQEPDQPRHPARSQSDPGARP